jgi:hypothetical protein
MFMRVPLLLAVPLAGFGLFACAVPTPDPGPESTSSSAAALVVVERTAGPGETVRGDSVVARVVRVRQGAVDDTALRIAGAAMDLPTAGGCVVPADSSPTVQSRSVELLDVGQISVTASVASSLTAAGVVDRNTVLMPRSMPDPAGVVSGVFYTSRAADVFAAGSRVSVRASGGADLAEGFLTAVTAPRDVSDVQVGAVASGLDVSWDASEADPRDLVYIDVLSPAPRVALRCATADTGHLVVGSNIEEGQIAVHRLHREAFRAKGIEPGEVRFDVARLVSFHR